MIDLRKENAIFHDPRRAYDGQVKYPLLELACELGYASEPVKNLGAVPVWH